MNPPLWSDLSCLIHLQKIEFIDISTGNQANRIFCSNIQCNRPRNALDLEQTKSLTQQALNSYEEQITEILRIKKLGEMEIQHHEIQIQNTKKMMNNIDKISKENSRIQQELSQNITSLKQLQKFCQLLSESKQNIKQQSDLQNISACLQLFMVEQENISKTMIPLSEQFVEQKNILDNQILSNLKLFNNLEEQILSKSFLYGNQSLSNSIQLPQQNIFLCPIHHEQIQLISLNPIDKQRAICTNCFDGNVRQTSQISQVLQNHEREYKKIQIQILSGEDFFYSLIKKSFFQIINILKQILNSFDEKIQQLDEIWLNTQKLLHEDDKIFNIQNFEQLEHLAQLHYKFFQMYYSNQQNQNIKINYEYELGTFLQNKIQPQNESIAKIQDQVVVQIKQLFIQFQQSFQFMQKTVQSKLMQQQVSNSIVTNFESSQEIKKILFDENNMTIILQQPQTVLLFQMEKDKFEQKAQQSFGCDLKDICFQNQCKWLVTGSEGSKRDGSKDSISELKFWAVQQLDQGRVEMVFEYQCKVKEILKLDIDHKNDNCVSFHQDEINIWKKTKNWEQIKKIQNTDRLLLAQFDSTSSHLAILFTNTLQIIICNQNQFLDQKKNIFEFKFQEIKSSLIKMLNFLNTKQADCECYSLLFYFQQKVALIILDKKTKQQHIVRIFPFPEQQINFLLFNNFISVVDKDNEVYSLYQINNNESSQDYSLIMITQIVSRQGFLNSVLSWNGQFLAIVSGSVNHFSLKIYTYIRMPHLNKIPTKSLNIQFIGC